MADKKVTAAEPQVFPAPVTPLAETPVEAEPTKAYYVVLHDGVDSHRQQAIVSNEQLGGPDVVERLLSLGAIKPLEA